MTIDRDNPVPLYRQVKAYLLAGLADGRLGEGAKLASERELVRDLGVSRITIRAALQELVMEGHLRSHPGKGFYPATARPRGYEINLARSFTETARAHGKTPGTRLLSAAEVPAEETPARLLGLSPGAPLFEIRRLRLLDGVPVMISADWVPPDTAPGLLALDWQRPDRSLYAELREAFGRTPAHGRTDISARLADAEERGMLGLTEPGAVLVVEQAAFDAAQRPLNASLAVQDPANFPLSLEQT